MAHELLIEIKGGKVSGKTAADAETLAELEGGTYRAVLTEPQTRSWSQLKLFWKFCEMIADNHPDSFHKNEVADALKIGCGHSRAARMADGTYMRFPRSIAFNNMPAEAFSKFMDHAFDVAGAMFGPALSIAARDELARLTEADATAPRKRAA